MRSEAVAVRCEARQWLLTLFLKLQLKWNSALSAAEKMAPETDQKWGLSERSEFAPLPVFAVIFSGTRRAAVLRSPSFAYFSWRSKKSERLPGRSRQLSTEWKPIRFTEEKTNSFTKNISTV